MDSLHSTIMTNANRKNMHPISLGVSDIDNIDVKEVLIINNANKIPKHHFDGSTYSLPSFYSYCVVKIRSTEKIRPMMSVSKISVTVSLKYAKKNINASVDIITGGINIFLSESGRSDAFWRTKMTPIPMKTAMIDARV